MVSKNDIHFYSEEIEDEIVDVESGVRYVGKAINNNNVFYRVDSEYTTNYKVEYMCDEPVTAVVYDQNLRKSYTYDCSSTGYFDLSSKAGETQYFSFEPANESEEITVRFKIKEVYLDEGEVETDLAYVLVGDRNYFGDYYGYKYAFQPSDTGIYKFRCDSTERTSSSSSASRLKLTKPHLQSAFPNCVMRLR